MGAAKGPMCVCVCVCECECECVCVCARLSACVLSIQVERWVRGGAVFLNSQRERKDVSSLDSGVPLLFVKTKQKERRTRGEREKKKKEKRA